MLDLTDDELEDWPPITAPDPNDQRKVKTAICQHCNHWIRVAAFPWCETDKDAIKEFRGHAKDGNIIDVMLLNEWNARPSEPICNC